MIVTHETDRTLCKLCFEESGEKLSFYVPDDKANYPCTCEVCGFTDLGPEFPETRRYRSPCDCGEPVTQDSCSKCGSWHDIHGRR